MRCNADEDTSQIISEDRNSQSFLDKRVLAACPTGQWGIDGACLTCDSSCSDCSGNPYCDDCIAKSNQYYAVTVENKKRYLCTSDCISPSNKRRLSNACLTDCQSDNCQCSNSQCVKCNNTSHQIFKDFKFLCGDCSKYDGFGVNKQTNECVRCFKTCLKCTGETQNECTECRAPYFLNNGVCKSQCDPGYGKNEKRICEKCKDTQFLENQVCKDCSSNCLSCTNSSSCKQCATGYYINDKGACSKCSIESCSICEKDKCTACVGSQYLYLDDKGVAFKCSNTCDSDGYYLNKDSHCISCKSGFNCKTCSSSDQCLTCSQDRVLNSVGSCVKCDQEGETKVDNKCIKCISNCKECQNEQTCKTCAEGFFVDKEKNICIQCAKGEFRQNDLCVPCSNDLNCASCSDGTSCLTCQSGFFLYKNDKNQQVCIKDCKMDGYFIEENKCLPCKDTLSNCTLCQDAKTCSTCEAQYFIKQSESLRSCEKCSENCLSCKDEKNCNECSASFFLKESDKSCTKCTEEGFYLFDKVCKQCSQKLNCKTCSDDSKCESCPTDYVMTLEGVCVDCKQEGFYKQGEKCLACDKTLNCRTCSSSSICDTCAVGFFEFMDSNNKLKCIESCDQEGFFKEENKCLPCKGAINNCTICKDAKTCSTCEEQYFIKQSENMHSCEKCSENCHQCKDEKTCNECSTNFFLKESDKSCTKCTEEGFYLLDKICKQCNQKLNCNTCSDDSKCESCPTDFVMTLEGACVDCKSEGFYKQGEKCLACDKTLNCRTCSSSSICDTCAADFFEFMDSNNKLKCIESCDQEGYFKEGDKCKKCNESLTNCLVCSNANTCTECNLSFFIQETDGKGECAPCSSNCNQCQDAKTCLKCDDSSYLYTKDNSCGKCQEEGFYTSGKKCEECNADLKCKTCTDSSTCDICQTGLFLSDNKACVECNQDGFYKKDSSCLTCQKDLNCKSCQNGTSCESCRDDYYKIFVDGKLKCIQDCNMEGHYVEDKECKKCSDALPNCTKCQNASTCLSCEEKYFLKTNEKNERVCSACSNNCLQCDDEHTCTKCSSSFFISSSENEKTCQACSDNCKECKNADTCVTCSDGYFTLTNSDGKQICSKCSSNCQTCSDQNTCTKCDDKFFIDTNAENHKVCEKCSENCLECSSIDSCSKCESAFFVKTLETKQTCSKCVNNCLSCKDESSCDTCADTFFFKSQDKSCSKCTEDGFFVHDNICNQCNQNLQCNTCNNNSTCLTCKPNLFLNNDGSCIACDKEGEFQEGKKCGVCNKSELFCKTCSDNQSCDTCLDGYYELRVNNQLKCIEKCNLEGYFSEGNQCVKCMDNCKVCSNKNTCQTCSEGYVYEETEGELKRGSCQKKNQTCKDNEFYSKKDSKCIQCFTQYQNCDSCDDKKCNQCSKGFEYNLEKLMCVLTSTTTLNLCSEKNKNCAQCDTNLQCILCNGGYEFNSEKICIQDINKPLDQTLSSLNYATVPVQVIGSFSALGGVGGVLSFSSQSVQQLGNFVVHQDELKQKSIGTAFVNQLYSYNLFTMLPQPKLFSNTSEGQQNSSVEKQEDQHKEKSARLLSQEYEQVMTKPELSMYFLESMLYWMVAFAIGVVFFTVAWCFRKNLRFFRIVNERKNDAFVTFIFFFSNHAIFNLIICLKNLNEMDIKSAGGILSIIFMILYTVIYYAAIHIHKNAITVTFGEKNQVKSSQKCHSILLTDISSDSFFTQYFWLIFESKKIVQILLTVLLNSILSSLVCAIVLTSLFAIYIAVLKPFKSVVKRSFLLIFEGLGIILLSILLSLSQNSGSNNENIATLAMAIVGVITLISLITTAIMIFVMIYTYFKENKKTQSFISSSSSCTSVNDDVGDNSINTVTYNPGYLSEQLNNDSKGNTIESLEITKKGSNNNEKCIYSNDKL